MRPNNVYCDDANSVFYYGMSLFNSMKTISSIDGLSGEINFDPLGNRENFVLEVLELAPDGLQKVGFWNSTTNIGVIETVPYRDNPYRHNDEVSDNILKNQTLIVLIAEVTNVLNCNIIINTLNYRANPTLL